MTLEYSEIMDEVKRIDKVNHPSHYTWLKNLCGIEVIDITRHMNFNLGNVIKYVLRAGHKSEEGYSNKDKEIEDLRKAQWYLKDEIVARTQDEPESPESKISSLQKQVENLESENIKLSEEIRSFNKIKVLGEFVLSKKEILQAAKTLVEYPDADDTIRFKQVTGGIGVCTQMILTTSSSNEEHETIVSDITDYDCW